MDENIVYGEREDKFDIVSDSISVQNNLTRASRNKMYLLLVGALQICQAHLNVEKGILFWSFTWAA